jgi:hypothetical protein
VNKEDHLNYLRKFTEVYKSNIHTNKAILEAECLSVQYPFMFQPLQNGDLFAGRYEYPIVYFLPQTYSRSDGAGFGYIFDDIRYEELLRYELSKEEKIELNELKEFWETENSVAKMKTAYPDEMRKVLPSDEWTTEPGVAFPLYRMAGSILDYDLLLTLGIPGIEDRINSKMSSSNDSSVELYRAMLRALEILKNSCQFYADDLTKFISKIDDNIYKAHLNKLVEAFKNIQVDRPKTLLEAVQLMLIYNSIS